MPDTGLLVTLALALIAATVGAAIAVRLGQSAILGYVVAGVIIGPYTPGFVAEPETVAALADVGLVFLLFAIGLELSIRDLFRAGRVAILGGSVQVLVMLALGYIAGLALGFAPLESLFFGAFVSMSSSAVLAKTLGERGEVDSEHGRVSLGWATLQDLSTIVLVVLLGGLSAGGDLGVDTAVQVGRAVVFVAILLPLGLRVLPWLLERIAALRSREVFVLSIVAVALGTAYLSELFGLSLALGAFLAGLLIGESDISSHALGELSPLRDVFAGLFFVSVGMFVDPAFGIGAVGLVLVACVLIIPVKGAVIGALSFILGLPMRTGILAGVALAQAGEFSFLLARLGVEAGAVGDQMFSLMLASAGVSIVLAPSLMGLAPRALRTIERQLPRRPFPDELQPAAQEAGARRYAVLIGHGRIGSIVAAAVERRGFPYVVVEIDPRICRRLRERGVPVIQGHAENPHNLARVKLAQVQVVVLTLPDQVAMRQIVHHIRHANPRVPIVARARTAADRDFLQREGVGEIVVAEMEVALEMARYTLTRLGVSAAETQAIVQGLRRRTTR